MRNGYSRVGRSFTVCALAAALLLVIGAAPGRSASEARRRDRFSSLYGLEEAGDGAGAILRSLEATFGGRNLLADVKVTRRLRCSDKLQALRDVLVGEHSVKSYEYVYVEGTGGAVERIDRMLGRDRITLMQLQDPEASPCWLRYEDRDKGDSSLWFAAAGDGAYLVKLDPLARNATTGAELLRPEFLASEDYRTTLVERDEATGTVQLRVRPRGEEAVALKNAVVNVERIGGQAVIKSMHFERVMDGHILRGRRSYHDFKAISGGAGERLFPHRIVDVQQGSMLGETFTLFTEVEVERVWVDETPAQVLAFLGRKAQRPRGLAVAVFWIQLEHGKAGAAPGQ